MSFFKDIERRRDADIRAIDVGYRSIIRNHLVQLFRKAHAVDPGLEGVVVGMGTATPQGTYEAIYDDTKEVVQRDAIDYQYCGNVDPTHPETEEFLDAVKEYSDKYMELPCIGDITLDDLIPFSKKKADVWRKR